MCGKSGSLVKALIEGVDMAVCSNCSKYGQVKKPLALPPRKQPRPERPEFTVVENYQYLLRQAREVRKMTQEEFAAFLQEKEGVVAKWENGALKPSVDNARKLERRLGLSLVVQEGGDVSVLSSGKKGAELTLGDFVKVRKRGAA